AHPRGWPERARDPGPRPPRARFPARARARHASPSRRDRPRAGRPLGAPARSRGRGRAPGPAPRRVPDPPPPRAGARPRLAAAGAESVALARTEAPGAAGFVNAILRRLAAEGPAPAVDPERDPLAWLTTAGSLPAWLAERWLARLGPSAALARARAFLERPP